MSKIKRVLTQGELVRCPHRITSLAEVHLFLGRWDITDDYIETYQEIGTGNFVFVYEQTKQS